FMRRLDNQLDHSAFAWTRLQPYRGAGADRRAVSTTSVASTIGCTPVIRIPKTPTAATPPQLWSPQTRMALRSAEVDTRWYQQPDHVRDLFVVTKVTRTSAVD